MRRHLMRSLMKGLLATGLALLSAAAAAIDYGDAPDSYSTLMASSGPSHLLDAMNPLYLGACVDSEADG
ncbi:MAG: hypothetical protein GY717_01215 [Rhodobacteraceae bacterium]|nr:hypothetical protein [Paracoccaceae bacterium]